jgi:hypothetical protein
VPQRWCSADAFHQEKEEVESARVPSQQGARNKKPKFGTFWKDLKREK